MLFLYLIQAAVVRKSGQPLFSRSQAWFPLCPPMCKVLFSKTPNPILHLVVIGCHQCLAAEPPRVCDCACGSKGSKALYRFTPFTIQCIPQEICIFFKFAYKILTKNVSQIRTCSVSLGLTISNETFNIWERMTQCILLLIHKKGNGFIDEVYQTWHIPKKYNFVCHYVFLIYSSWSFQKLVCLSAT